MKFRPLSSLGFGLMLALSLFLARSAAAQPFAGVPTCSLRVGPAHASQYADFGRVFCNPGDYDGDGLEDFIVGTPADDHGGCIYYQGYCNPSGRAFLFRGGSFHSVPDFVFTGLAGQGLGTHVARGGDFNADGFDDLIIGRWGWQGQGVGMYYGGPTADAVADIGFTSSVGMADGGGDFNGDGYDDVIATTSLGGQVDIYFGGPSRNNVSDGRFVSDQASNWFGSSITFVGDVNGDGRDDVVVGAPRHDEGDGRYSRGRAYLYLGRTGGFTHVFSIIMNGTDIGSSEQFGSVVAGAGDVNGDGFADFLVGTDGRERAYLYYGGPGLDLNPDFVLTNTIMPNPLGTSFGDAVASAGDLNSDGYDDVIVGDWSESGALVFLGGSSGITVDTGRWWIEGPPGGGGFFGDWVAPVGDLNADGRPDVAVGAHGYGPSPQGTVVIFSGPGPVDVSSRDLGGFAFAAPSPNPTTEAFRLALTLPREARVDLDVLDLAGRVVARPVQGELAPAGLLSRTWRPSGLASGCYLVRARAGGEQQIRRVVWLGTP